MVEYAEPTWIPIKSDSENFNLFLKDLGFPTYLYGYQDVLVATDPAYWLSFLPQPMFAIILIWPYTDKYKSLHSRYLPHNKTKLDLYKSPPPIPEERALLVKKAEEKAFFLHQKIRNACGTMAILHSALNIPDFDWSLVQHDSFLHKFKTKMDALPMTEWRERGELLVNDYALREELAAIHHKFVVKEGDEENCDAENHFTAFVQIDGEIFELDGRCEKPKHWGGVDGHLGVSFVNIFNLMIELDPTQINFAVLALCANSG